MNDFRPKIFSVSGKKPLAFTFSHPPESSEASGGHGAPRVLHVGKYYPPYRGGMESHLQTLCGELRKSIGVSALVANETRQRMESEIDGVPVRRLPRWFRLRSMPVCPALAREIRRANADIVHLHLPNPLASLSYLLSGDRSRLVITWHSDIVRQRALARLAQPIEDALLGRAAMIIATSPNYVESSPVLSRNRSRCKVIPFGVHPDTLRPRDAETVAKIRARYGPNIALAVGRLVYYKGFEYLIRAMPRIDGRLLMVGEGPLRQKLERAALALGAADRITFLGRVSQEEVAAYFHAADVFTMPSTERSEAFGIAQLEAMACGKPVVNTRIDSGVPFVSLDGVTGITVPPGDSSALADAINRLFADKELAAKYGAAGKRRTEEEFSVALMARRTLELYREVLGVEALAAAS